MLNRMKLIGFLICLSATVAPAEGPRVFREDPAVLDQLRQRYAARDARVAKAVDALCKQADKAMSGGPYAVTQKKHPASGGDPHDYVSLAPYFWPNPNTPDHLPYVRHDGRRNPEIREYDASRFGAMSSHARTLALAYYLTGDEPYADRAVLLLRTWFLDPATRMNPNLEHAQMVMGADDGRGTGIIESARLLDVVDAVGLLHGSKSWTDQDDQKMREWFRQYVDWMLHSRKGRKEQAASNNHGMWYDVQIVTYCLFIGDEPTARRTLEEARQHRIASQIEPDGSQPRELTRTNAISYSVFNIEALTELADLGRFEGVDLWNYKNKDGRSIRAAINWILPYATGKQPWKDQQISSFNETSLFVPLRRAAAALNEPEYRQVSNSIETRRRIDATTVLIFPGTK